MQSIFFLSHLYITVYQATEAHVSKSRRNFSHYGSVVFGMIGQSVLDNVGALYDSLWTIGDQQISYNSGDQVLFLFGRKFIAVGFLRALRHRIRILRVVSIARTSLRSSNAGSRLSASLSSVRRRWHFLVALIMTQRVTIASGRSLRHNGDLRSNKYN